MTQPARVQIVEVSPRDGLQAETRVLATEIKLELLDRLADTGLTAIEATSFVRPTAVPQLADADDLVRGLRRRPGVRYPVLVPNEKGLERAIAADAGEIAVFVSASESYSRKNLRRARDDAIATALAVAATAVAQRLRVRAYVSMVVADPHDGPTDPTAVATIAGRFLDAGADEISLGDTMGAGTAKHVRALLAAQRRANVPIDRLAVHFHDTYGQGLANALVAIELGITIVDSSIGGIGGSPFAKGSGGNLATEDLVWMLDGMGIATGVDLRKLAEATRWLAAQLGRELPGRAARALAG